jgi:tetratricopeptide (TPR) repeat protein/nucleoside phosphorylase
MAARIPTAAEERAPADVLIVTAIREERDAVKAVATGAVGTWIEERAPSTELRIERRAFRAADGGMLQVALICAEEMGGAQTVGVAGPVVMALRPRCLAMCGVLGGKPADTEFGDVLLADQLVLHDTGKRTEKGFEHATRPHKLDVRWLEKARDFAEDPGDALAWLQQPPWTPAQERAWLLDQFSRGFHPPSHAALLIECCPSYRTLVRDLVDEGLVQPGEEEPLTDKGKSLVRRERFLDPLWPGLDPPRRSTRVHVGPIVSGNAVQADPALWRELSAFARKALGVEMESHAVGTAAELHQVELALVMKGVMDHADKHKDDRFKPFAARASAECLLAFLRRYLPTEVRPGYDDLLTPGTAGPPNTSVPSKLLDARHEVVPWQDYGRSEILTELDAWADDVQRTVSVRLLHAEGGIGKTRLAIEWARRRRARGDMAGFLVRSPREDWFERLISLGAPVVAVIDYAETRSDLSGLLERILAYRATPGNKRRFRLLLLARNDGDWWSALRRRSAEQGSWLDEIDPCELGPLAVSPGARAQIFYEAAQVFAVARGRKLVHELAVPLEDPRFKHVIYLHMAALASVEGIIFKAGTLMDVTLDHEERFWSERGDGTGDDKVSAMHIGRARQIVAAATLRGGLRDADCARRVLERLVGRSLQESDELLLRRLHDVYARANDDTFMPGLEPDLLGEFMVLRVAFPPESGDRVAEDWIDRVFPDPDDPEALHMGFVVLGRASAAAASRASPWIARMLATRSFGERALLALDAATHVGRRTAFGVLGDELAAALELRGDVAIALQIEEMGLPEHSMSLRRVAEWVSRTALGASIGDADEALAERARHANNLGLRRSELGRTEEALEPMREAVSIWHKLAAKRPDVFLPQLAISLNNIGIILSEMGRHDEALAVTQEAVNYHGILARRSPYVFLPDFAMSLHNLGTRLSALGRFEDALTATRSAAKVYRKLADEHPDAFLSEFAGCLNNLSIWLSDIGRTDEALDAARDAVGVFHTLAEKHPDAFLPDLAGSLLTLGARLSDPRLGDPDDIDEALEVTREGAKIYRSLANRRPDAFQRDLAASLLGLGARLRDLGRLKKSLEVVREAAGIFRSLADKRPEAFVPDLAVCLDVLGTLLGQLGHRESALETASEALDLYWPFFERVPDAYARNMANMLKNVIDLHANVNRAPPVQLTERAEAFARIVGMPTRPLEDLEEEH